MKNSRISPVAGFTLVELLVVIVFLAILGTLTITVSFGFRKKADRTSAMNAMRQIQLANISYAADHNGSFVPPEVIQEDDDGVETGVKWFENPDFIAQLKGSQATFSGGGQPDVSVHVSLLDRVVIRNNSNSTLKDCFGYTAPALGAAFRQAQLSNPTESAAFITCDGPFVDHATRDQIAYRHQDKALVVYYDGRAAIITTADIASIEGKGGAANAFWKADAGAVAPSVDP